MAYSVSSIINPYHITHLVFMGGIWWYMVVEFTNDNSCAIAMAAMAAMASGDVQLTGDDDGPTAECPCGLGQQDGPFSQVPWWL